MFYTSDFAFFSIISFTSFISYILCCKFISMSSCLFLSAGLKGRDYGRPGSQYIPEAVGVVASAVYLCVLSINILVPFIISYYFTSFNLKENFNLVAVLAGCWSICSMSFLGFTDDVLNLRWRHKLILPIISSFPLILVYHIQGGPTSALIPFPFKYLLGTSINLGPLFLIYTCLLTIFCTNSINILAGINGLEVGQSIVIACSLMAMSFIEFFILSNKKANITIFFIIPFTAVSSALLRFNWYPASIFVGDTFCYFTGMTFAVVAILSQSSRAILLLFIPQILNFLYSLPQLLKLLPCPRHRLPSLNEENILREPSTFVVRLNSFNIAICAMIGLMARFGLAKITRKGLASTHFAEVHNMTLLNLYLWYYGPTSEEELSRNLIKFQIYCACIGLFFKYSLFYLLF